MSNKDGRKSQANVTGAYIFFCGALFRAECRRPHLRPDRPTRPLPAQDLGRIASGSWGADGASGGALTIKPTFGLLSDFVPLLGSRRRSYLLVANGLAATSLLLLALVPLAPESRWLLFVLLGTSSGLPVFGSEGPPASASAPRSGLSLQASGTVTPVPGTRYRRGRPTGAGTLTAILWFERK